MGKNIIVVGTQWGDEGKGKIVDVLTQHVSGVIRFQGGNNAGHTLVINGEKAVLRLIPSGIFHDKVRCFLASGIVLSPRALLEEIAELKEKGLSLTDRLFISKSCSLLLPYHEALDKAREEAQGEDAIGTTKRGIGPAYEDKVARRGLRASDLLDPEYCAARLEELAELHNFILQNYYGAAEISFKEVLEELMDAAEIIKPLLVDVPQVLHEMQNQGENLLFEGAQGTYLDIDHGTYPYVTSSNTVAGAAATGSGFGPLYFDEVVGVTKAYTTRVGAGPFATELKDAIGQEMAERGHEFGSVTKRARRCGWFDACALKRSIILNSLSSLVLTKLDVLDGLETVRICVAYEDGKPVYEDMPGWKDSTFGVKDFAELPKNAKNYIKRIEELLGLEFSMISTGPARAETIILHKIFN